MSNEQFSEDVSYELAKVGERIRTLDAPMDVRTPQTATIAYVKDALGAVKQLILETHDQAQVAELKDIEAQLLALYKRLVPPTAAKQQLQPIDASGQTGLQKGLEEPEISVYRDATGYACQREFEERAACGCTRKPAAKKALSEPEIVVDRLGYMSRSD